MMGAHVGTLEGWGQISICILVYVKYCLEICVSDSIEIFLSKAATFLKYLPGTRYRTTTTKL